jgi:hypothetical protein
VLSIITGGGKWIEITIPMDPLYLSVPVVGGKEVLALCPIRRNASSHQRRAAAAAYRGDPDRATNKWDKANPLLGHKDVLRSIRTTMGSRTATMQKAYCSAMPTEMG